MAIYRDDGLIVYADGVMPIGVEVAEGAAERSVAAAVVASGAADQAEAAADRAEQAAESLDITGIKGRNPSASAPTNPVAFQFWADATTGKIKARNASNTAWVEDYDLWAEPLSIAKGGTGAVSLAGAKTSLEVVSYGAQSLTAAQREVARANIGLNGTDDWAYTQTVNMSGNGVDSFIGHMAGATSTVAGAYNIGGIFKSRIPRGSYNDPDGGFGSFFYEEYVGTWNQAQICVDGFNALNRWFFRDNGSAYAAGTWISTSDRH